MATKEAIVRIMDTELKKLITEAEARAWDLEQMAAATTNPVSASEFLVKARIATSLAAQATALHRLLYSLGSGG